MTEALKSFDRIVVDTAPLVPVSDTLLLLPFIQTVCMLPTISAPTRITAIGPCSVSNTMMSRSLRA